MHKIIGALSIFLSVILISYYPIYEMKERVRCLSAFMHALHYVKAEFRTNLTSLPALMDMLCNHSDARIQPFFESIKADLENEGAACFSKSISTSLKKNKTFLIEREEAALRQLGEILGRYAIEDEINEIEHTLEILQTGYEEAKARLKETEKLYISSGIVISLVVIITLL